MYDDIAVMIETIKIELKGSMPDNITVNVKYAIVNRNIYKYIPLLLYLEFTVDNPTAKYILLRGKSAISMKKAKSCALFLFFKESNQ